METIGKTFYEVILILGYSIIRISEKIVASCQAWSSTVMLVFVIAINSGIDSVNYSVPVFVRASESGKASYY